jgi:GR25 family glycosyltransferase involved in LPS biosynthesis
MKTLYNSYNMDVDKAYIIRVKGNEKSEELARRCAASCISSEMPHEYWDAYNGIEGEIVTPRLMIDHPLIRMLKITDHYMTRGEVACALSHISLWSKCAEEDKPLVILEHDSIMVQAYRSHGVYNSICYLGGCEQALKGWQVYPTPPHASEGPNYRFICRAHAYAIDPAVAKNMIAYVLKQGIHAPLDIMIRADIFSIHQMGLYAYDLDDQTTILNRPREGRTTDRNDRLEY